MLLAKGFVERLGQGEAFGLAAMLKVLMGRTSVMWLVERGAWRGPSTAPQRPHKPKLRCGVSTEEYGAWERATGYQWGSRSPRTPAAQRGEDGAAAGEDR